MWLTRKLRIVLTAVVWLLLAYSSAHAHGGMAGPDELGPPVITSAILGIGGYWTVMLWPSRKNPNSNNKSIRRPPQKRGSKH